MALSQKEMLRRIKHQGNAKVGMSSKNKSFFAKTALNTDREATPSDPKLKKRKMVQKDSSLVATEGLESNDHPTSIGVPNMKKSFSDEEFLHLAHGQTNNYSAANEIVLAKRPPHSMHEDLLRYLHQE
ncbi:hypothetical protein DEO72_LG2g4363 [Vigna unguiculata]|uniref:Uncharacterized protein n=1 Tax=Vigna unguiculata TaxID=3917 RepID=A0A4D6L682_VIGUN|nr:hypothetical protein DEO72_LG2g4363 [Vigna unguiculata]